MMRKTVASVLLAFACLGVKSQTIQLLKDIWPDQISGQCINYQDIVAIGDTVYCQVNNGVDGNELWMHDPVTQSMRALKSIGPKAGGPELRNIKSFNGTTYFLTKAPYDALWKTDGTVAGTQEIIQFGLYDEIITFEIVGPEIIFLMSNGVTQEVELWKSDGTSLGTIHYHSIPWSYNTPEELVVYGNALYFDVDYEYFKTDGTPLGTVPMSPNPLYYVKNLTVFNGKLWFTSVGGNHGRELWYSDGTANGTQEFEDFNPNGHGVEDQVNFQVAGGRLYYVGKNQAMGAEIRSTDGTLQGTMSHEYIPGAQGIDVDHLFGCDSSIFFSEATSQYLCTANANGVTALLPSSTAGIFVGRAVACGDSMYFISQYSQLWRSDGTVLGTENIMPANADLAYLVSANGRSVYCAGTASGSTRSLLWKTDGSVQGTIFLASNPSYVQSSSPIAPTLAGNYVYFLAKDSAHGQEIWRTDGTDAGTIRLSDIDAGSANISYAEYCAWQGNYYITMRTVTSGYELWRSDGTPGGTIMLADILPGSESGKPEEFYATDSFLYFRAAGPQQTRALWRTDGSPQGTVMVNDFGSAGPNGFYKVLGHANGNLFLNVTSPAGSGLWVSDGSIGNGNFVRSFHASSGLISSPLSFGNRLWFVADDSLGSFQIWISDGTPASTFQLTRFTSPTNFIHEIFGVLDGYVYFQAYQPGNNTTLWRTDGTVVGTMPFFGFTTPSDIELFAMDDSLLYFTGHQYPLGEELWVTDGDPLNTRLVQDIFVGNGSSECRDPRMNGHILYFAAKSGLEGEEIYWTDGTSSGTHTLPTYPGLGSGYAGHFGYTDRGLLYQGADLDHGTNLYLLDGNQVTYLPDPTQDPQSIIVDWAVPLAGGYVMGADNVENGKELFFLDGFVDLPLHGANPKPVAVATSLVAYPNPASEWVNLAAVGEKAVLYGYELYDLAGQCVGRAAFSGRSDCVVDMRGLAAGMYVLAARCAGGKVESLKVVKQ